MEQALYADVCIAVQLKLNSQLQVAIQSQSNSLQVVSFSDLIDQQRHSCCVQAIG